MLDWTNGCREWGWNNCWFNWKHIYPGGLIGLISFVFKSFFWFVCGGDAFDLDYFPRIHLKWIAWLFLPAQEIPLKTRSHKVSAMTITMVMNMNRIIDHGHGKRFCLWPPSWQYTYMVMMAIITFQRHQRPTKFKIVTSGQSCTLTFFFYWNWYSISCRLKWIWKIENVNWRRNVWMRKQGETQRMRPMYNSNATQSNMKYEMARYQKIKFHSLFFN